VIVALFVGSIIIGIESGLSSLDGPYANYPVYYGGSLGHFLNNPATPAPTGLAAFGLEKTASSIKPYVIQTSGVIGNAYISALSAYNASLNIDRYGTTLQLNTMLMVNTSGAPQIFWLQNTALFDTKASLVEAPEDEIFNLTARYAPIDVVGGGSVAVLKNQTYYSLGTSPYNYNLPLNLTLGIFVYATASGVVVNFYNSPFADLYPVTTNQTGCNTICAYYRSDSVKINIQNVRSAALVVTPYRLVLGYLPSDTELTWGGPCCGFSTNFTQMQSSLSLAYINAAGQQSYFPAYFSFGGDTGEYAANLVISRTTGGGTVAIGREKNALIS
jgi:hypothetical protein